MLNLPPRFAEIILSFTPVFVQQRTWHHAKLLLLGALLTPGQRTVCSILRIVGLRRERHFVNYHRVVNQAVWHSRFGTCLLLERLLRAFVPTGPVLLGVDDTVERRRGKQRSPDAGALIEVVPERIDWEARVNHGKRQCGLDESAQRASARAC